MNYTHATYTRAPTRKTMNVDVCRVGKGAKPGEESVCLTNNSILKLQRNSSFAVAVFAQIVK